MLIVACKASFLAPSVTFLSSFQEEPTHDNQSHFDQHRVEELIRLGPSEREPSVRTVSHVLTKLCLRGELDNAHVASSLLDTDEIVDVDVGLLHTL
jgi:hypothetical protein